MIVVFRYCCCCCYDYYYFFFYFRLFFMCVLRETECTIFFLFHWFIFHLLVSFRILAFVSLFSVNQKKQNKKKEYTNKSIPFFAQCVLCYVIIFLFTLQDSFFCCCFFLFFCSTLNSKIRIRTYIFYMCIMFILRIIPYNIVYCPKTSIHYSLFTTFPLSSKKNTHICMTIMLLLYNT